MQLLLDTASGVTVLGSPASLFLSYGGPLDEPLYRRATYIVQLAVSWQMVSELLLPRHSHALVRTLAWCMCVEGGWTMEKGA